MCINVCWRLPVRRSAVPVAFCIVAMAGMFGPVPFLFGQQNASNPTPQSQESQAAAATDSQAALLQELQGMVGKAVRISTKGGGQFQGKLYAVLEDRTEVLTSEGLIQEILIEDIVKVLNIESPGSRLTYFQDAAESRLLVMPTGFPLPKGDFQVTDQEIALVTSSYGVTDWFSIWGGVSIPGAVVNARFSVPIGDSIGLSAGSLLGFSWMIGDKSGAALPYVIASFGKPNQNFTVGVSVPVYVSSLKPLSADGVIVGLAGKVVISQTASLVTENWFYVPWDPGAGLSYIFPALAFRIAGSRFSWDIGAVVPLEIGMSPWSGTFILDGPLGGMVIPLPLLSLTYRI